MPKIKKLLPFKTTFEAESRLKDFINDKNYRHKSLVPKTYWKRRGVLAQLKTFRGLTTWSPEGILHS